MSKVLIDRELLDLCYQAVHAMAGMKIEGFTEQCCAELRAILARPIQQGESVEVVEVVGYRFFHVDHGYIFRRTHIYEGNPSLEAHSLMTVAQHQRILTAERVPAGCKVVPVELLKRLEHVTRTLVPHLQCHVDLRALLAGVEGGE